MNLESGGKSIEKKESAFQKSAPISVDWDKLKEINEDIIGWVYFTGLPQISYPILQAEDNAYYVNRTYDLSSDDSKAGSIFMDYRMHLISHRHIPSFMDITFGTGQCCLILHY